ncbi:MAG: DUF2520 domain-containing protein [Chloroflexi bacterium]|nr:DUF2520 domain-containing protein [Chloroflexota bacterium]
MKVGFIGAGTVGTALAVTLSQRGYPVAAVASKTRAAARKLAGQVTGCQAKESAQQVIEAADLIFVTTPDDAIAGVVAQLQWRKGKDVVHCSGAASLDILEPARRAGAGVGALHPLQTFASVAQAIENIPGSTFGIEAEGALLETLKSLATALGGHAVELGAGDKVLYHAAAVIACNYFVTLVKMATDLWQQFGVSTPEATRAMLPLIQGTVNNLKQVGLPNCLTGPIARGDMGTLRKHLEALEEQAPALVSTYRELGLQTIPVSLAKGKITPQRAEEMRSLFNSN